MEVTEDVWKRDKARGDGGGLESRSPGLAPSASGDGEMGSYGSWWDSGSRPGWWAGYLTAPLGGPLSMVELGEWGVLEFKKYRGPKHSGSV
jgi:hypothetical protein